MSALKIHIHNFHQDSRYQLYELWSVLLEYSCNFQKTPMYFVPVLFTRLIKDADACLYICLMCLTLPWDHHRDHHLHLHHPKPLEEVLEAFLRIHCSNFNCPWCHRRETEKKKKEEPIWSTGPALSSSSWDICPPSEGCSHRLMAAAVWAASSV